MKTDIETLALIITTAQMLGTPGVISKLNENMVETFVSNLETAISHLNQLKKEGKFSHVLK